MKIYETGTYNENDLVSLMLEQTSNVLYYRFCIE